MDQQPTVDMSSEYLVQHPIVAVAFIAFTLIFIAFIIGALSSWAFLIIRALQGKPLLALEPWRPRVWGFVDILLAVVFIIFWQFQSAILGYNILGLNRQELAASESISLPLMTISGLGNVAALLTICTWIIVRHGASLAHLGFGFVRWWKHITIGFIAALASIPFVYALMAAVSVGFDNKYSHPLLEEMKRDGTLTAYLLAVTSAVLIAPLVEEFFFRVLIQGWLQSAPFGSIKSIFLGQREQAQISFATISEGVSLVPNQDNPYAPLSITVPSLVPTDAAIETAPLTPPIWPAVVTGTLFGLVHFSYGLSFIPLIFLGIILGLLYRATHSIWPSLAVHFILNSSSMLALGITVLIERASN
jgi:membrane protease YdiL (CAAX protease family)